MNHYLTKNFDWTNDIKQFKNSKICSYLEKFEKGLFDFFKNTNSSNALKQIANEARNISEMLSDIIYNYCLTDEQKQNITSKQSSLVQAKMDKWFQACALPYKKTSNEVFFALKTFYDDWKQLQKLQNQYSHNMDVNTSSGYIENHEINLANMCNCINKTLFFFAKQYLNYQNTNVQINMDFYKNPEYYSDPAPKVVVQQKTTNGLSESQQKAFEILKTGRNCFIYGEAGSGKSTLITKYCEWLEKNNKKVLKCAFTGIAAQHIKGNTLHQIFVNKTINDVIERDIEPIDSALNKLSKIDCVIIDEISMVRIDLFDFVMRTIRLVQKHLKPKMQVILSGDFYQLPPVLPDEEKKILLKIYGLNKDGYVRKYAFEGEEWKKFNFCPIKLTNNMRQQDRDLVEHLNNIKTSSNIDETLDYFNKRVKTKPFEPGPGVIQLAASNAEVNRINSKEMEQLDGEEIAFNAILTGEYKKYILEEKDSPLTISKDKIAPELSIKLKKGARVMFIQNENKYNQYKNGTTGVVIDCYIDENTSLPYAIIETDAKQRVEFCLCKEDEKCRFTIRKPLELDPLQKRLKKQTSYIGDFFQIPVKVAFAITIHKAQGKTFEKVNFDPSEKNARPLEKGQLYVALSRITSIDGLHLERPITREQITKSDTVIDFYNSIEK